MANSLFQEDPFFQTVLDKMPAEVLGTLSTIQLQAFHSALVSQPKRKHVLDLRWQLGVWHWNYYFAFFFGRNHRELTRREQIAERWALATAMVLFVTISTLFGLLVLYLIKSAMGIDIFPHYSLGIWGWFKEHF